MGVKSSKYSPSQTNFNISDWINQNYSSNQPSGNEFGRMKTLKNKNTDQCIDKYENIFTSIKDYENYLKSFEWRRNQEYIVKTFHIICKNNHKYCSNTYQVDIYIEHPKNRLSDFSDIPYPDTLYCLRAMLLGYEKLYRNVGAFPVKQEQICIDEGGNVKVWFNRDLSKNYPQQWEIQPKFQQQQDQEQEDMVSQIVQLVTKNSDDQLQPNPSFQQFFDKTKRTQTLDFQQTIILIQQYAHKNSTQIPQYFKSVLQVYQDQDQLYELPNNQNLHNNESYHQTNDSFLKTQEKQNNLYQRQRRNGRDSQIQRMSQQSRSSKFSNIDNLQRNSKKIGNNQLKISMGQNQYQGEVHRLSNISRLEDNYHKNPQIPNLQRKQSQNSQNYRQSGNEFRNNMSYKQSDQSHANYSQISFHNGSKNQTPVWMSLKPQQPYIPSSHVFAQPITQTKIYHNSKQPSPPVSSQSLQDNIEQINLNPVKKSRKHHKQNYSISQKAQQNSISAISKQKQNSISKQRSYTEEMKKKLDRNMKQSIKRSKIQKQRIEQQREKINNEDRELQLSLHSSLNYSQGKRLSYKKRDEENSESSSSRHHFERRQLEIHDKGQSNTNKIVYVANSESQPSNNQSNSNSQYMVIKKSDSGKALIELRPIQQPFNSQNSFYTPALPGNMLKNSSYPIINAQPMYPPPPLKIIKPINPQFNSINSSPSPSKTLVPAPEIVSPRNLPIQQIPIQRIPVQSGKSHEQIQASYCTVSDNILLDPQIAKDMQIYI